MRKVFGICGDSKCRREVIPNNPEAIKELFTNYLSAALYPVGSIYMSTSSTNPSKFMGFGTWEPWGSGRVPVGIDKNDSNFNKVEKTGGSKTHALTIKEIPSHTHGMNDHTHSIANHTHSLANHVHDLNNHTHSTPDHTHSTPDHTHTYVDYHPHDTAFEWATKSSTASGVAVSAKGSSSRTIVASGGGTTGSSGTGVTGAASGNTGAGGAGNTGAGGAGNTGGASGNTTATGSGSAHNNLQPYVTCYMWKRTA